jgi:hypothetical protein
MAFILFSFKDKALHLELSFEKDPYLVSSKITFMEKNSFFMMIKER